MHPFPVGDSIATERSGLLLCEDRHGEAVWSEASPLPGWSHESLDDVLAAIRQNRFGAYPSLQFAYETLSAKDESVTSVPVNALLVNSDDIESVTQSAERLSRTDFQAVKLKVGRLDIADDIAVVHSVRSKLRRDQRLRLDANRAWSPCDAIAFGKACGDLCIEYIEEPVRDPTDCERFSAETGLRYALDETLLEAPLDRSRFPNPRALIIKPTLYGGFSRINALAELAVPLVFSSAFETRVGLANIAKLASAFGSEIPVGLDTHRWLLDDIATTSCDFNDGIMSVRWPLKVDTSRLKEVQL